MLEKVELDMTSDTDLDIVAKMSVSDFMEDFTKDKIIASEFKTHKKIKQICEGIFEASKVDGKFTLGRSEGLRSYFELTSDSINLLKIPKENEYNKVSRKVKDYSAFSEISTKTKGMMEKALYDLAKKNEELYGVKIIDGTISSISLEGYGVTGPKRWHIDTTVDYKGDSINYVYGILPRSESYRTAEKIVNFLYVQEYSATKTGAIQGLQAQHLSTTQIAPKNQIELHNTPEIPCESMISTRQITDIDPQNQIVSRHAANFGDDTDAPRILIHIEFNTE